MLRSWGSKDLMNKAKKNVHKGKLCAVETASQINGTYIYDTLQRDLSVVF